MPSVHPISHTISFNLLYSFLYKSLFCLTFEISIDISLGVSSLLQESLSSYFNNTFASNNFLPTFRFVFYLTVPEIFFRRFHVTFQKMMHLYLRKINKYFDTHFFFFKVTTYQVLNTNCFYRSITLIGIYLYSTFFLDGKNDGVSIQLCGVLTLCV